LETPFSSQNKETSEQEEEQKLLFSHYHKILDPGNKKVKIKGKNNSFKSSVSSDINCTINVEAV
jgi:hypothetical protein